MDKIETGKAGEKLAVAFLKQQGFKILETNFKSKLGEIDIVALDQNTLVFVEVKARTSLEFGLPEEAVGYRKLEHIRKSADYYRSIRKNLPEGERIDVVAIEKDFGGNLRRLELIKNVTG